MDDTIFSTLLPLHAKNLGGKYSNATPPNHGGMSFGCSEDEEYQCDECNFKNKEKVAVAKHKKHQHEAKK